MVPKSVVLPTQHTDATITVAIEITDDGRVHAPGLPAVAPALYRGCVPHVEQMCALWSQWLARVEQNAGVRA